MVRPLLAVGFFLLGVGCGASEPASKVEASLRLDQTPIAAEAEYLVLGPRAFEDEMAPLLAHRKKQGLQVLWRDVESVYGERSHGAPSAQALRSEIEAIAARPNARLRFVLLAGDPSSGVPTFMRPSEEWAFRTDMYPADHGLIEGAARPLAIGRFPARSEREAQLFASKTVRYEAEEKPGAWQRRALIFGGPAEFGPIVDGLIEAQAQSLLDRLLPYDYDINVLFAKKDSPYAYRFDQLGQKLAADISEGALIAVYAGHGLETSFDATEFRGRGYTIGQLADIETINTQQGSPFFISLTCLTGDFGMATGARSVGETMLLRPHGPVAVFASSGVSHPYPNLLYARALIEALLAERAPTVGEAVVRSKAALQRASLAFAALLVPGDHDALKKSHLYLYNLLGDPALRLRMPEKLQLSTKDKVITAGSAFSVPVEGVSDASYQVTIETERAVLKAGITTPQSLDAMPLSDAFATMVKNYRIANDKVLFRDSGRLVGGRAELQLLAPKERGLYVVKVLAVSERGTAAGHVRFEVN